MIYTIKQGDHSPSGRIPALYYNKTHMKFKFNFISGCWYPKVVVDDFDVNKLYGFSHGDHEQNSVRVGWIPGDNERLGMIDISLYIHNNGVRTIIDLCSVPSFPINSPDQAIEITCVDNVAVFSKLSDNMIITTKYCPYIIPPFKFGYKLFPYVGGNPPARQDTKIEIIEL